MTPGTPGLAAGAGAGAVAGHVGVLDLYRGLWTAGSALAARHRLALLTEIAFVAAYAILRTAGASRDALLAWIVAAVLLSIVAPSSGLVVLAAIAPFSEPVVFTRQLGAKPVIIVALGAGTLVRLLAEVVAEVVAARGRGQPIGRPPLPLVFAAVVAAGTAIGVAHSGIRFGGQFGVNSLQSWLAGIGGMLVVLAVGYWSARGGNVRPLVAAVAAGTVGGIVSLIDWLDATALRESAVGWLLRPNRFATRLTGIISSPNGVASLLVIPTAVLAAAAALGVLPGRLRALRVLAGAALVPLGAALYFTYSRAALLAMFVILVIVVWRIRRRVGIALLVGGLVLGAVALPAYLSARFTAIGNEGTIDPSGVLVASDRDRLNAWASAGRMFAERPLTGHGFLAYGQLHEAYGDPRLRSPHNEWLRLFAEEGVIVGLAGLGFLASTLAILLRGPGWWSAAAAAAFAAWALTATFNNPTGFIQVGIVLGCVVGPGLALAVARQAPNSG